MRVKGRSEEECRHYERLELELAAGGVPGASERRFMAEHRATCEQCRAEAAVSELMRHTDDAGPAQPLDELSGRRFVNYVVNRAAADGPLEEEAATTRRGGRRPWQWASAAAVLLALGVGLVLILRWSGGDEKRTVRRDSAQLVMRSGEVVVEGAPARRELAVGKTLSVRQGQAAIALPDDAYVLLGARTAARVVRLSATETTLHLEQGWLLAVVKPKRHRRRFIVTTRAGRVEVKGTIFTVRVTPQHVTVEVLRGQVKLVEPSHPQRLLVRGNTARLGGPDRGMRPLSVASRRVTLARMASLALVGGAEVAQLQVRSQPAGAQVSLDGVVLGRTPLSARIRAGHRRLQIQLAGRTPVAEQLTLRAGDRIHRDYELIAGKVAVRSLKPTVRSTTPGGAVTAAPSPGAESTMEVFPPVIIPRSVARRPRTSGVSKGRSAQGVSSVTAGALLKRAQKRRAARDWRGAAASYRLLLSKFPRSSASRAARVALGLLLLDHLGSPAGALRLFNTYLLSTRRGVLAQEAAYGRIRALRRLGRRAGEIGALRRFLKEYPGALQTSLVKRRLTALTAPETKQP